MALGSYDHDREPLRLHRAARYVARKGSARRPPDGGLGCGLRLAARERTRLSRRFSLAHRRRDRQYAGRRPSTATRRSSWAGQAEWTCSARTQRVIRTDNDRRRLDLELLFQRQDGGSSRSERILLWIEIKHGSEPRDDQLAAYLKLMKARSFKNAAVLLLAPRSDYPSFEVAQMPSEVPRLTWEETGRIISSFATTDPVSHFLVDELVAYLREEALMDPPELTREHLVAFQHYEDGMRALLRVCELAEARVSELWANHEEKGTWPEKRKPRDYWWNYGPDNYEGTISISCPTDWAVSWELLTDSAELLLDGKPGVPVFLVGLAGPAGGIATMAESTRAKLQDAGFRVLPLERDAVNEE